MLPLRANVRRYDSAVVENHVHAFCFFSRAGLLAAVWTGKLSLVFRHCITRDRARTVAGEPAARQHDGARGPFAGVGVEHRLFLSMGYRRVIDGT